jgi:hypothetical protein
MIVLNAHLTMDSNWKRLIKLSCSSHSITEGTVRAPAIAMYITNGITFASWGKKTLKVFISFQWRLLVPNDSNFGMCVESKSESYSSATQDWVNCSEQ